MEQRKLGRTGEKIPALGLGTWRIGVYRDDAERTAQVRSLVHGIELGMNLIDTAEVYASGKSEEVVGQAVAGIRDKVFIASKVSSEHLRHDSVISACNGSLKRLGTDYIDLYQVHWPNSAVPIRETMRAMEELVEMGKVRYIGVSNFDVSLVEEARTSMAKNEVVSDQVEYSMSQRSPEDELIPYCRKTGTTLIAYSPLARGRIVTGIPRDLLETHHLTPAQAMLNWVTRDDQVVAIPKAASLVHLDENAASLSARFTEREYARLASGS